MTTHTSPSLHDLVLDGSENYDEANEAVTLLSKAGLASEYELDDMLSTFSDRDQSEYSTHNISKQIASLQQGNVKSQHSDEAEAREAKNRSRLTKIGFGFTTLFIFLTTVTGIAYQILPASIHRMILGPLFSYQVIDEQFPNYHSNEFIVKLHVFPSLIWNAIVMFQMYSASKYTNMTAHKWLGYAALLLVPVSIFGAILMLKFAFARSMIVGTYFFGALFMYFAIKTYTTIRDRDIASHREFALRMIGVGAGPGLLRLIFSAFNLLGFTADTPMHRREDFGTVFWLSMTSWALLTEMYLMKTRKQKQIL
jgi:hypothetical protein